MSDISNQSQDNEPSGSTQAESELPQTHCAEAQRTDAESREEEEMSNQQAEGRKTPVCPMDIPELESCLESELHDMQRLVDRIPPDILAELKRQQRQHGKER